MDLQSVMRDKFSLAVIEDLLKGETGQDDIAKRNHLPASGVDRAVRHLMAEGIIGGPRNSLHLTEKGKELVKEMKGLDRVPSGVPDPRARSRPPERHGPEDSRQRKENQGA